jgi:hypothetical protein
MVFAFVPSFGGVCVIRGATDARRRSGGRVLFSYLDIEARVPAKHPMGTIRRVANAALAGPNEVFAAAPTRPTPPSPLSKA